MKKVKATLISTLLFLCLGGGVHAEHGALFGAELDHTLEFPHFGNGSTITGSIFSELVLVNRGSPTAPIIYFFDTKGEMIEIGSLVEMTENLHVTSPRQPRCTTSSCPFSAKQEESTPVWPSITYLRA